jgi:predicted MPP superfamily phosphohydrolase
MTPRRRFLHPLWLIASLPLYIGWRLIPSLALGPVGSFAAAALLIGACIIVPLSVRRTDRLAWTGLISLGFFSTLFVMTLLRDLVLSVAWFLLDRAQFAALLAPSARSAVALTALTTVVGLFIARRPHLVEVEIPIARLPVPLQGFSIAQISDLHVGPTIRRGFVERLVRRVNSLEADMIAVTGDLVDGPVAQLSAHTAPLANLIARHGAYFVTGNHEYYSGESAWTSEIRRLGMTVLKNQHVVLKHDGALLVIAGVDDIGAQRFDPAQRSDPAAALHGAPAEAGAKILLAHQPGSAAAAALAGFDLQICGHTHGGQFWPWNHFVRYFQPFTAGLHRLKSLWVYVSRGTGYWGPPNRFGVPSEITRIRLINAPA